MRTVPRWLLAACTGAAVCGLSAAPALAKKKTGPPSYSVFAQCPTSVADDCVYSETTSGQFVIGSESVPINAPITFQGGIVNGVSSDTFVGATNGDTLSPTALTVPGGLLGLTDPSSLPQPLQGIVDQAIATANTVTATAELVGNPTFSYENFLTGLGSTVSLPVEIQLSNPFLGSACYIGSSSDPVTLNLTTGTTAPPSGVTPLKGTHGKLKFYDSGNLTAATNDSIVDNTFAAPGVTGCGGIFSALIDPVVDLKTGLPAAAGTNSAVLDGSSDLASASSVIASGY